jgi:hypothetical protein
VTPASLDFGNVPSASTSAVQTLTVTSSYGGPSSIMVDTLVIPPGYARSGGSCPIGSAVTSPCTIGIVFQPPSPGILAGNIAITATSNGFLSGTTNVPATGNGVAFRVVPALSNLGLLLLLAGLGGVGSVVARRR